MKTNLSRWTVILLTALALVCLNLPFAFSAEECGEYGTSVEFADSPAEAAKQALEEEKLVFVLHVSGHFEDSDFT